jgi:Lon-like ATP-dependent protease
VEWYNEVFDLVFPDLDKQAANTCKICEWQDKHGEKSESAKGEEDH